MTRKATTTERGYGAAPPPLQAAVPLAAEGSISTSGWLMILLAALGAVSVGIVPNRQ